MNNIVDYHPTDVGGGSVKNDTPNALARIPLRWMIRECFRCKTGIIFDAVILQQIGLHVTYDQDGQPMLKDAPARLSPQPEGNNDHIHKSDSTFLLALVRAVWMVVSYPFLRFAAAARRSDASRLRRRSPLLHSHDPSYRLRDDVPGTYEAEEELKDALSPLNDQLKASWWWNILEYVPVRVKKQKAIIREIESLDGFQWTCVALNHYLSVLSRLC